MIVDITRRLGARPSYPDYRNYRVLSPTRLQVEQLPVSYWKELLDYTPDGMYGDPNKVHPDQGQVGSCVGWDGSIALETTNNIEDKGYADLSAWWAYGRSRAYCIPPVTNWLEEGSTNYGLMKALNNEGCVKELDCPTPTINQSFGCFSDDNIKKAADHALDEYWEVNPQPNDVKAAIYGLTHEYPYKMSDGTQGKGPLISAFPVYQPFMDAANDGTGVVPNKYTTMLGGHSSALIGWVVKQDLIDYLIQGGVQTSKAEAVVVEPEYYANYGSWGESAGFKGLFWIPTSYPFYPNDFFLIHNGPPTNNPVPPTPSSCAVGNTAAKILNTIPWAFGRQGRMYYLNPSKK